MSQTTHWHHWAKSGNQSFLCSRSISKQPRLLLTMWSVYYLVWAGFTFFSLTATVTLYCIDPAVQSAMRTSGKARRLYSYLPGCNSQLYNLLPQPGSKQTWTPGLTGPGKVRRHLNQKGKSLKKVVHANWMHFLLKLLLSRLKAIISF